MSGSDTWGIDGTRFLELYGVLAVATLIVIWQVRKYLTNTGEGGYGTPTLDAYELAMLNGGPELAITTAAAKLHGDGALAAGSKNATIVAVARPTTATEVEHAVYGAVERTPGMKAKWLRRDLEDAPSIYAMTAKLTQAGLLLDDGRRALIRSAWVLAVPLLALGVARMYAGASNDKPIEYLFFATAFVAYWTVMIARRRRWATARGTALLDALRSERSGLEKHPTGAEIPLAVALFGTGVLWLAAPEIASAYAIARDGGAGSSGGSGGGCGGGGCGGGCGG